MLDRMIAGAGNISRYATWVGGLLMMLTAFVVTFDVIARKFAGFSLEGADELSGYAFAIATSWAFAHCLLQRGNVRIDGIYLMTPIPIRALLDIIAMLALGLFLVCLLYSGWTMWVDSYLYEARAITPWRTKLVYPQTFWLMGWIWLLIVIVLLLLRCFQALFAGRFDEVVTVAGVRTLEEEVAAEIAHAAEEVRQERSHRQSASEQASKSDSDKGSKPGSGDKR